MKAIKENGYCCRYCLWLVISVYRWCHGNVYCLLLFLYVHVIVPHRRPDNTFLLATSNLTRYLTWTCWEHCGTTEYSRGVEWSGVEWKVTEHGKGRLVLLLGDFQQEEAISTMNQPPNQYRRSRHCFEMHYHVMTEAPAWKVNECTRDEEGLTFLCRDTGQGQQSINKRRPTELPVPKKKAEKVVHSYRIAGSVLFSESVSYFISKRWLDRKNKKILVTLLILPKIAE